MKLFFPAYYHDFTCLAGQCPDSCCKEWDVVVDDASAARYRALSGPLGDRLRQVLRQEDSVTCMTIENRRCPMWRDDGLCRIQAELGHDALCQTCRDFPRLTHDYGDFTGLMLELSCPEAARLIFSNPYQLISEQLPGGSEPDYDRELMSILLDSRNQLLQFLNNTDLPLNQALAVLLLYAHTVQSAIDQGGDITLDGQACLILGTRFAGQGDWMPLVGFFRELEILTDRWKSALDSAQNRPLDPRLRPLATYMVHRYWLQAVSDYDLISRAKLIVVACILVSCVGGDPVGTSQLFSKEIENNADNLDAILDAAYAHPAFTDANLLGILLQPAR